jgi:hypothetical protein
MNKPLADKHRNAMMRLEMARAAVETARLERRLKFLNEYDVLKGAHSNKRRVPSPEFLDEDGVLSGYKRGQAIAMGRDLQRNFAGVAAALNQFMLNAVGKGPKLRLHSKADATWAETAAGWFNGTWTKNCDFRDDLHFGEMVGLLEVALKREGDALLIFDDFGIAPGEDASGKLLWYESDQFVEPDKLPEQYTGATNTRGVICDKWGRRLAYAVHSSHGRQSAPLAECTVFPAAVARHIKRTWRFNQVRGTPALLGIAADTEDLYEIQSSEMQTAKTLGQRAGFIETEEGNADTQDAARGDGTNSNSSTGATYRRLEALCGGAIEYLDRGDLFKPLDWQRPALNFVESIDQLLRKAMAALGLSQTYSLLRVTSSYTAFRGEMLLAWAQFYFDQKFLERHACDWTAGKALAWQYDDVPADLSMSWDWPRMPAVDPLHEAQAVELLIKTLQTNYSEQLGPEWQTRMKQLSDEIKKAKELGLPTVWEGEKQGLSFREGAQGSGNSRDGNQDGR